MLSRLGLISLPRSVSHRALATTSSRHDFTPSKIGIIGGAFGYGQVVMHIDCICKCEQMLHYLREDTNHTTCNWIQYILWQVHQGVKNSPYAIRQNGIIPDLTAMGHDVKDYGNLQQEKLDKLSIKERYLQQATKNQDEVGTFNEKVCHLSHTHQNIFLKKWNSWNSSHSCPTWCNESRKRTA